MVCKFCFGAVPGAVCVALKAQATRIPLLPTVPRTAPKPNLHASCAHRFSQMCRRRRHHSSFLIPHSSFGRGRPCVPALECTPRWAAREACKIRAPRVRFGSRRDPNRVTPWHKKRPSPSRGGHRAVSPPAPAASAIPTDCRIAMRSCRGRLSPPTGIGGEPAAKNRY